MEDVQLSPALKTCRIFDPVLLIVHTASKQPSLQISFGGQKITVRFEIYGTGP